MTKIFLILIACGLIACSTEPVKAPTPFTTGDVIAAPQGCAALRAQNPKADC